MKISEDMTISEIISKYPNAVKLFEKYNMDCNECISAEYESLKQGLDAHGVNSDQFIRELDEYIKLC